MEDQKKGAITQFMDQQKQHQIKEKELKKEEGVNRLAKDFVIGKKEEKGPAPASEKVPEHAKLVHD